MLIIGTKKKNPGSSSYVLKHIFRKFSNISANNNVSLSSVNGGVADSKPKTKKIEIS